MESLANLLQSKKPNEPPQLQAMKDYVKKQYGEDAHTAVSEQGYSLIVSDAGLASHLQMEKPQIVHQCNLDKKLFIRIGHF